jgi:DNA-binding PadR family transcriptional regulator
VESDTPLPDVVARAIAKAAKRKEERGLTQFRIQLVIAINKLGKYAYGHMIYAEMRTVPRHAKVSFPQIYTTLQRMEEKGYLTSTDGKSAIEGARRVTIYALTDKARTYLPSA